MPYNDTTTTATLFFCLMSVGYHLELRVPIAFYQEYQIFNLNNTK